MDQSDFYKTLSHVFACFMAWFFFKSGMFHKEGIGIKESFGHAWRKLLRPYLFFLIAGYIIMCIFLIVDNDTNWIHYTLSPIKQCLWGGGVHGMALPLWFLVTLLSVKSLSPWFLAHRGGCGAGLPDAFSHVPM